MARLIGFAKLVFVQPFVWIMGKVSGLFKNAHGTEAAGSAMLCNRQSQVMQCRRAHGVWDPGVDFGWGGAEREAQKHRHDWRHANGFGGGQGRFAAVGGERSQETTGHPE